MKRKWLVLAVLVGLEPALWLCGFLGLRLIGVQIPEGSLFRRFHPLYIGEENRVETEYDPYTLYRFRPNLKPSVKTREYATDRYGFPINSVGDTGGNPQVFLFGGSTIMGSSNATMLGAFLEQECPRFDVITAGMSGYQSTQELMTLETRVLQLNPSVILTFDGINDAIFGTFLKDWEIGGHLRASEVKAYVDSTPSVVRINPFPLLSLMGRTATFRLLGSPLEIAGIPWWEASTWRDRASEATIWDVDHPKLRLESVDAYIRNLDIMDAIGYRYGIRVIHVLQPTLGVELAARGGSPSHKEWATLDIPHRRGREHAEKKAQVFKGWFDEASARFREKGWVDLSRMFKDEPDLTTVYYDYVHYHDWRTAQIAKELARLLH